MKITIDTKTDSHDEIKRAIQLLSYLVRKDKFSKDNFSRERIITNSANINIGENLNNLNNVPDYKNNNINNPPNTNAFANMFGTSIEKKEEPPTVKDIYDTAPNFNSFLNLMNENNDNNNNDNNKENKPPKITLF